MPSTETLVSSMNLDLASEIVLNPSVEQLAADCVEADACKPISNGAVVAYSGKYTGRTPKDKYIVVDSATEPKVWWNNNNRITPDSFFKVRDRLREYTRGKKLYVIDTFAGADPAHRISVRFIVERAYHALFIKQLLIRPTQAELASFDPAWTIVDLGKLTLEPGKDGVAGDAVIALNFSDKQALIAGTEYAGEMKKSVFTIMNYLLPQKGVLSMHCSANIGLSGDTALFFGLSGTGKTTLSTDPERRLIGDDEHGWTEVGVFNIEGGCYAKCVNLSQEREPEIWNAIKHGSILENVVIDSCGEPDYDDKSITENTRVAYPLEYIPNAELPSIGNHPTNIVFLTCDAVGVLPPISRLTPEQAMVYYLNGYTAKVAGTERGVLEPTLTFSTCFGQPFLPLAPKVYADLLGEKIREHSVRVWLVNTGWTGGPYGVGSRMKLAHTRAMLKAAFDGLLDDAEFVTEPVFGLNVPLSCPDVPDQVLQPRSTWADTGQYDAKAQDLKRRFDENYAKFG